MRKILLPLALVLNCTPVLAHDFWIQPDEFVLEEPASVPVSLFVGHGQDRSKWGVDNDHVTVFNSWGPDGMTDLRTSLRLEDADEEMQLSFDMPGAHLVGLESRSSFSDLPAERFNDYVAKEGIASIADYRQSRRLEGTPGREFYNRRAKAIVQVGPVDAKSVERVTTPLDFVLEITPRQHPLALADDRMLPVTVTFKGQPLNGALVKLTDLNDDAEPVTEHRTDADGKASFRIPQASSWQLNVVWSEPIESTEADFQTTFSSLSFASE